MPIGVAPATAGWGRMLKPDLVFLVGFSAGPRTPLSQVVWTDITPWVRSWSTLAGRQHELNRYDPSTATILLDNRDGRFRASNTSSPYSPNLLPMRRFRIQSLWQSVTRDVFTGYLSGWPNTYAGPSDADVTLTAVDAMGSAFVTSRTYGSPWQQVVRRDRPIAWYRLGESDYAPDISGHGWDGTYQVAGTPPAGSTAVDGLLVGDYDKAFSPQPGFSQRVSLPYKDMIPGWPFTVECWFRTNQDRATRKFIIAGTDGAVTWADALYVSVGNTTSGNPGRIECVVGRSNVYQFTTSSITVDDNQRHHLVISSVDGSPSGTRIYIDGANVTSSGTTTGIFPAGTLTAGYSIGNLPALPQGDRPFVGVLDELVIYDRALDRVAGVTDLSRIQAHFTAGSTGWGGDRAGERIGRILDEDGWPAQDRQIDLGVSTLRPGLTDGSVTSAMQAVETTEQGQLYMDRSGNVRFLDRHYPLVSVRGSTVQHQFGPDAGHTEYTYEGPVVYGAALEDIYTEATGSRQFGPQVTVYDQSGAADTYGPRAFQQLDGLMLTTDNEVRNILQWRLGRYSRPVERVRTLRFHPAAYAALFTPMLDLQLGDRVQVRVAPPGGGPDLVLECTVERIAHEVGDDGDWWTTLGLSAADTAKYWILGSGTLGRLGIDTRLGV